MSIPTSYQEYLERLKSHKGVGDTVAAVTHATGLDKLSQAYEALTGKDCGCNKRRDQLNKIFPYNS